MGILENVQTIYLERQYPLMLEVLCVPICVELRRDAGAVFMWEIGTDEDQIRNIFHPHNEPIRINLPDNAQRLHFNKYGHDSHWQTFIIITPVSPQQLFCFSCSIHGILYKYYFCSIVSVSAGVLACRLWTLFNLIICLDSSGPNLRALRPQLELVLTLHLSLHLW